MITSEKRLCPVCKRLRRGVSFDPAAGKDLCPFCQALSDGTHKRADGKDALLKAPYRGDIYRAKRMLDKLKAVQQADIRRYSGAYGGIITVLRIFPASRFTFEKCGNEFAKIFNKPVALGFCSYGMFSRGDRVRIIGREKEKDSLILELVPFEAACSLEEQLQKKSHKAECFEGNALWLIFDCGLEDISADDKIAVCPIRPAL